MAQAPESNFVRCYHCGREIEVGQRTMSTRCAHCHKPVMIEDIVVKGYTGGTNIETCGRHIVHKRGHAVAKNRIVANGGIEVKGRVQCDHALTPGKAVLFSKAVWKGDLAAQSLVVEKGAVIQGKLSKVETPSERKSSQRKG